MELVLVPVFTFTEKAPKKEPRSSDVPIEIDVSTATSIKDADPSNLFAYLGRKDERLPNGKVKINLSRRAYHNIRRLKRRKGLTWDEAIKWLIDEYEEKKNA